VPWLLLLYADSALTNAQRRARSQRTRGVYAHPNLNWLEHKGLGSAGTTTTTFSLSNSMHEPTHGITFRFMFHT
jgi:hypothetical protein